MTTRVHERPAPAMDRDAHTVQPQVVRKLGETLHAARRFRLASTWIALTVLALALLGVMIVADWWLVLPRAFRVGGLVCLGSACLGLTLLLRVRSRGYVSADAAVEVEQAFPELGQRVRTTLEYTDPASRAPWAAPGLVGALVADTDRRTTPLDFGQVIPWRKIQLGIGLILAFVILGSIGLVSLPELRIATARVFLADSHYTRVSVQPGNHTIKAGADFSLVAELTGRPAARVLLRTRAPRGDSPWKEQPLVPLPRGVNPSARNLFGKLSRTLKHPLADFEYQIVAADVETEIFQVRVVHELVLKRVTGVVQPPAYTRAKTRKVKQASFDAIEGSTARMQFTLDQAPQSASIKLVPPKGKQPAEQPQPPRVRLNDRTVEVVFESLDQTLDYELAAVSRDGMPLHPERYRIRVLRDKAPSIQFTHPPEELEALPTEEVSLRVDSGDDFGVQQVGIVYQVGSGPEETLDLTKFADQPTTAKTLATLYLEKHEVDYTDALTYYAYVDDNYPRGAHRTRTELRFIDIRPFQRDYQLVKVDGEGGT